MTTVRIIGPGRAGLSLARAFTAVGIEVREVLGRDDDLRSAASGVDMLFLTVPDRAVASAASVVRPVPSTVVAHCSGALGLEVLAPHERVASLHPLVTLPDPVIGAVRLRTGGYFVVAGDQLATDVALALGGRPLVIAADRRAEYHAAACMASNHLVALLGQVQRVAATVGLPLEAFLPLARGALDDVGLLGPAAALTGPAARGDTATIEQHRKVLDAAELDGYDAGVALARRLAGSAASKAAPYDADRERSLGAADDDPARTAGTGSWR
ncbi:MAG TPA: DUF2520 domain-containing protein [Acidimicrobiales bacterium]|nr:DUF2520 domain-containing protein [Acidimicrobiales bacterium]